MSGEVPGRRATSWTDAVVAAGAGRPVQVVLASATRRVAAVLGVDADGIGLRLLVEAAGVDVDLPSPPADVAPEALGLVREALLAPAHRRTAGAFYTPAGVAAALVDRALEVVEGRVVAVCDPAVGGGAFLLAAARALHRHGVAPDAAAAALYGADVDPLAVQVAEASIALWAAAAGGHGRPVGARLVTGDALAADRSWWPESPAAGFDAVVGNPPFLNQLSRRTARDAATAAALRGRFGRAAGGYADTAAVFAMAACRLGRAGGAVCLVLPESFLAARDAAGARADVLVRASLVGLWTADEPVFRAGVRVCAPVLRLRAGTAAPGEPADPAAAHPPVVEAGSTPAEAGPTAQERLVASPHGHATAAVPPVRRWSGAGVEPRADVVVEAAALRAAPTWSVLLVDRSAAPTLDLVAAGAIGEWCAVTADFRDQYYGLVPHVVDDDGHDDDRFPPLVTTGLVDPAACEWGRRPARFAKQRWRAPRIDRAGLSGDAALARWATARLVPKVVVATQTRVIEAAVDERGRWLPCTPLVTVAPPAHRLWHAAAVLLAPPVTAWAIRHHAGAALTVDTLKLSARQVGGLPYPADGGAWDAGAAAIRAATAAADDAAARGRALLAAGEAMCAAYGVAVEPVLEWWAGRLPVTSSAPPAPVPAPTAATPA